MYADNGLEALSIELSYFDPSTTSIYFETFLKKPLNPGQADKHLMRAKPEDLDRALQGYERIFCKQKYLAGDHITLADLVHLPEGAASEPFGFGELLTKYPATEK